jgi:hypothetical protein
MSRRVQIVRNESTHTRRKSNGRRGIRTSDPHRVKMSRIGEIPRFVGFSKRKDRKKLRVPQGITEGRSEAQSPPKWWPEEIWFCYF